MQSSGSVDGPAVTYEVAHTTAYLYAGSVSVSHHIARLSPRKLAHQLCVSHTLAIEPSPAVLSRHVDYFGNPTTVFAMQGAHTSLTVRARSVVTRQQPPVYDPGATPPWEEATDHRALSLDALECVFDSTSIRWGADAREYARRSFPPGRPLLEAVLDLTARIHDDFAFDTGATTVATPLTQVFTLRRGVCQDFARVEIACLRSLGIAARYVSGYLETVPAPGKARLVGADASHAWVAVYCPAIGWIDVDPTNNVIPSSHHITLAWGRDYDDVSPMRGVILGGGDHRLRVNVDVNRL
jgi:transglutaminase-like putative cysteine protease